jgi:hypothetical protein
MSIRKMYPREESSYSNMLQRCYNPKACGFEYYGERGIKVCDRWRDNFYNFYQDMGPRPKGTTLDRKNVNGDYEPRNCRWATYEEQANNKRDNTILTYNGISLNVTQWALKIGIKVNTLECRIIRNWPVEEALGFRPRTKPSYSGRLSEEQIAEIIKLRKLGKTNIELGVLYNIDDSCISRLMKKFNIKPEVNEKDKKHQEIYDHYLQAGSQNRTAKELGIAFSTVNYAITKTKAFKLKKKTA